MTELTMRELASAPNLTRLFGKAALGTLHRGRGSTLPAVEYARSGVRADRAQLAGYDRVCGFRLTDELPITYPHLLTFGMAVTLMTDPDFPFPMIGLVHMANRITQTRPLRVDEPLVVRVRAENLRAHERGCQFDMVSEVFADGEPVWTEVSGYLRRAGGGKSEPKDRDETPPPAPDAVWRVPEDIGRRYARVSGDHNPIHLHPLSARLLGFPRAIAHGMWSKARCLAFYEGQLPGAYSVDVRFKLPILLPAKVALRSSRAESGWQFGLTDERTGKPHLTGTISR